MSVSIKDELAKLHDDFQRAITEHESYQSNPMVCHEAKIASMLYVDTLRCIDRLAECIDRLADIVSRLEKEKD